MLSIDLTSSQKLQIGFITVVLAVSAFLFFRNTRPILDQAVKDYRITKRVPVDPTKRFDPIKNPYDPKKQQIVYTFACVDGMLSINEYINDSSKPLELSFKPETRRQNPIYQYYHDPLAPLAAITDPLRHALAHAVYRTIYAIPAGTGLDRPILPRMNSDQSLDYRTAPILQVLGQLALSREQRDAERVQRTRMVDKIDILRGQLNSNSIHGDLMNKLISTLNTYKKKPGDAQKDSALAQLDRTIIVQATDYINAVQDDKKAAIGPYLDEVIKLLTEEQKSKLADLDHTLTGRRGSSPRAAAARPPATRSPPPPTGSPLPQPAPVKLQKLFVVLRGEAF